MSLISMPTLSTTPPALSPREATLADAVWGGAGVAFGLLSALALMGQLRSLPEPCGPR